MAKLPSFQFYPGDWMKDPNLRRCSHAAKGVWIDMLCLMFECDERGVLASGGVPWGLDEIARAVGGAPDMTLSCVEELLAMGVASRNSSGAIFSRRLVRDEQERIQTRERVRKHRNGNGDVTQKKRPCTEDEDEEEDSSPRKGDARGKPPAGFDAWWGVYPRKVGRKAAVRAYRAALRDVDAGTLLAGLRAYVKHKPPDVAWCHPTTWLNAGRWEDEHGPVKNKPASAMSALTPEQERELYEFTMRADPSIAGLPMGQDTVRRAMKKHLDAWRAA